MLFCAHLIFIGIFKAIFLFLSKNKKNEILPCKLIISNCLHTATAISVSQQCFCPCSNPRISSLKVSLIAKHIPKRQLTKPSRKMQIPARPKSHQSFMWLLGPQRTSLLPISEFVLDEKFQRNASKSAIFYIYENPKLHFLFFISC